MAETPEYTPPPPPSANDRNKATRIRGKLKIGVPLTQEEDEFYTAYIKGQEERKAARGASRAHTVEATYRETSAEAEGTGEAASVAAAASFAREEGRRYDYMLNSVISATKISQETLLAACQMHREMAAQLLKERDADRKEMRVLLGAVRTHFLAAAETEATLIKERAEAEIGQEKKDDLIEQALPIIAGALGIPIPTPESK